MARSSLRPCAKSEKIEKIIALFPLKTGFIKKKFHIFLPSPWAEGVFEFLTSGAKETIATRKK